jgi:hypothetical protein
LLQDDCTARLPRTTRSKTSDPQRPSPTRRPFYESAIADKVVRNDRAFSCPLRLTSAPRTSPIPTLLLHLVVASHIQGSCSQLGISLRRRASDHRGDKIIAWTDAKTVTAYQSGARDYTIERSGSVVGEMRIQLKVLLPQTTTELLHSVARCGGYPAQPWPRNCW